MRTFRNLLATALAMSSFSAACMDATTVFARMKNSVYVVRAQTDSGSTQGSAVRISSTAVVTNCHVVGKAASIAVHTKSATFVSELLHSDYDRDLCTLKVIDLPPSEIPIIRRVDTVRVGERVFALGAPRGLELSLSEGIVAAVRESDVGRLIQTTASISPGSSGGALFDAQARLIGITSFQRRESQNLNFAAPAEWITDIPSRHIERSISSRTLPSEASLLKLLCKGRITSNDPMITAIKGGTEWFETIEAEVNLTQPSIRLNSFFPALLKLRNRNPFALVAESQLPYALTVNGDSFHHTDREQMSSGGSDYSLRIVSVSITVNRKTAELALVDSDIRMSLNPSDSKTIETRGQYQCERDTGRKF